MTASVNKNHFQHDLFAQVGAAYAEAPDGALDNAALYNQVAERTGIDTANLDARVPIGHAGALRSPLKRKIRWYQLIAACWKHTASTTPAL